MKAALSASLLALASAHAPPRIELDLSGGSHVSAGRTDGGMTATSGPASHSASNGPSGTFKLATPVMRSHDLGYKQPDLATPVYSKQEITMVCEAGPNAASTCHVPTAKAWDWQDKSVPVTERIFLIDSDGTTEYTEK